MTSANGTDFRPRTAKPMRSIALGVLLGAGLVAAGCSGGEPVEDSYSGYVVDPPLSVAEVALPDAVSGEEIEMPADPGELRLVYFGFLSCPDVCPTTMSDVKRALADMEPEDAARVNVGFVTVDPNRDDGERMVSYLSNFVEDGDVMRTDDPAALKAAADGFGVGYEVVTNEDGEIEVGHTADLFAVNSEGTVVMQWPFGTKAESLSADLTSLLDTEAENASEGTA